METSQEAINELYAKMERDGWDVNGPMKWGFFFFSEDEEKLKEIHSELNGHNYSIENFHRSEDGEWVLQVTKSETLLPDKLYRRCMAFNQLAEAYGSYFDGWDVDKNV